MPSVRIVCKRKIFPFDTSRCVSSGRSVRRLATRRIAAIRASRKPEMLPAQQTRSVILGSPAELPDRKKSSGGWSTDRSLEGAARRSVARRTNAENLRMTLRRRSYCACAVSREAESLLDLFPSQQAGSILRQSIVD